MVRVQLNCFFGHHVARCFVVVREGLRFLDFLHLGRVAVLRGEHIEWGLYQLLRELAALCLKYFFHMIGTPFECHQVHRLKLLHFLLFGFVFSVEQLHIHFGN